jgi:general secretion pathway protein A
MMYQQFFGFKEPPFNLTPDSKFLFLSHRHQEALAAMLFGVQERKGFICLTGEIGCGKTTLCRALLSQLDPDQVKVCMVLNSYLTDLELLKTINEGFGLRSDSDSKKSLLDALNEYLVESFSKGRNVVLVIDEAQNLRPETLEQVRMISNLETETDKLIQIMLIGQPELRRTLALPELEQLNQRITVRYHIMPLEEKEISDYIRHRLSVAEPQVEIEFTPQSFRMIHHYSRGVPRRINVICDRCLLIAYTQGTFTIDDKIVQQAVDEVRGESQGQGPVSTATGAIRGSGAIGGFFKVVFGMAALVCLIAAGIYIGNLLSDRQGYGGANTTAASTPKTDFPAPRQPVEGALPAATPEPAATAAAQATATPRPTATPYRYEDWQFDGEKTLRVQDNRLSEAASYINLMRLWNIEIELSTFRETPAPDVARFDLLAMVKANPLNFQAFQTEELGEALRPDLPVILQLDGGDQYASWALITSMSGEMLTLVDPIHGKRTVRRPILEPLVRRAIVLYRDTVGLTGIQPGEGGERVQVLQAWLAREGYYVGPTDGKFGSQTSEALRKLQNKVGLEPTGMLDGATMAAICAQLSPKRPSLYS